MKKVICIAGDAACGKSTASRELLARLPGWRMVSAGARFREFCDEQGIDSQQIPGLPDQFHRDADQAMLDTLRAGSNLVVEGRLVGYLARDLEQALRVFFDCSLEERALRLHRREPQFPVETARARLEARDGADREKFLRLYGIDYRDPRWYDLRVDTGALSPAEVAQTVLQAALLDL
jgi:cytidylate kinase